MPKRKLTDAFVRTAQIIPTKKGMLVTTEYADQTTRGLSLRVTPNGAKSWTYRYRINGKQKRLSLGKIENVSLADARRAAQAAIGDVATGGDPVKQKLLAKLASKENIDLRTVDQVWQFYDQECEAGRHRPNAKPKKQSTLELERYYYNSKIAPALGSYEIADLEKAHIQKFVSSLNKSAGQRCRSILHSLFTFCQRNEIVDKNPVQFVHATTIEARETVLSDSQIKTLWHALTSPLEANRAPISLGVALSIKLSLVTLQRRGEIAGLQQSEIDFEKRLWIIPATRTKNSISHVVPLSNMAIELIEESMSLRTTESEYLFPSPKLDGEPINPKAITRAFGRLRSALSLGDIRPHDLRRTGATNLTGEALGFTRFTVSKVLNHTSDTGGAAAVTGVYDRNEYLTEKRRALDAWAFRLQQIVNDEPAHSNIIQIRG